MAGLRGVLRQARCVMADPHDEDSESRWFGVKRPRLKWILLAVLVVDVVVVGSLVAANLASGAKPMSAGPTEQIQPKDGTGPSSPPARVCGNAAILGAGPTSAPARSPWPSNKPPWRCKPPRATTMAC